MTDFVINVVNLVYYYNHQTELNSNSIYKTLLTINTVIIFQFICMHNCQLYYSIICIHHTPPSLITTWVKMNWWMSVLIVNIKE